LIVNVDIFFQTALKLCTVNIFANRKNSKSQFVGAAVSKIHSQPVSVSLRLFDKAFSTFSVRLIEIIIYVDKKTNEFFIFVNVANSNYICASQQR